MPIRSGSFMDSLATVLGGAADQAGRLRYGVPTSQKEALARSGSLPGSPSADTADSEEADRYASGYLFAQEHPTISGLVQPVVDRIKTSSLPLLGGSDPDLQSYASAGANAGRIAAQNATRNDYPSFMDRLLDRISPFPSERAPLMVPSGQVGARGISRQRPLR